MSEHVPVKEISALTESYMNKPDNYYVIDKKTNKIIRNKQTPSHKNIKRNTNGRFRFNFLR